MAFQDGFVHMSDGSAFHSVEAWLNYVHGRKQ